MNLMPYRVMFTVFISLVRVGPLINYSFVSKLILVSPRQSRIKGSFGLGWFGKRPSTGMSYVTGGCFQRLQDLRWVLKVDL